MSLLMDEDKLSKVKPFIASDNLPSSFLLVNSEENKNTALKATLAGQLTSSYCEEHNIHDEEEMGKIFNRFYDKSLPELRIYHALKN
jgi:hypothetical protein